MATATNYIATGSASIGFRCEEPNLNANPKFGVGASGLGTIHGVAGLAGPGFVRPFSPHSVTCGVLGSARDLTGVAGTSRNAIGVYGQSGSRVPDEPPGEPFRAGVVGTSLRFKGVIGRSDTFVGVEGRSNHHIGVLGSGGVLGGVQGFSEPGVGVSGHSIEAAGVGGVSNNNVGVIGIAGSDHGVVGLSGAFRVPLPPQFAGNPAGVHGTSEINPGVSGSSQSLHGVLGYSINAPGVLGLSETNIGVHGRVNDPAGLAGLFNGRVVVDGDFVVVNGTKAAAVPFPDGSRRVLYCVESPDHWFEDFGMARLSRGRARVKLDSDFAKVIGAYHVFLTPRGDCNGLYVASTRAGAFEVRELGGGTSSVGFSYRIVGRRKDVKRHRRFAKLAPPPRLPAPRKQRRPTRSLNALIARLRKARPVGLPKPVRAKRRRRK